MDEEINPNADLFTQQEKSCISLPDNDVGGDDSDDSYFVINDERDDEDSGEVSQRRPKLRMRDWTRSRSPHGQSAQPNYSSESEEDSSMMSSPERDFASDGEIDDPSFLTDQERGDEHSPAEDPQRPTQKGPKQRRPTQRGCGRGDQTRSRSPHGQSAEPHHSSEPWKTETDPDTAPQTRRFTPRRAPGAQVDSHSQHSPMDLFSLYFSNDTMMKLCKNTNKNAAKNLVMGKKYRWIDVDIEELYKFLGLLMYTSLVSLPSVSDYWKQNTILSVPFPATVMTRDRFRTILWNIYLSDPDEDVVNEKKKGTPQHDKLFRVKPLIDDIRLACKAYYQPRRELAVDERIVATHAKSDITQYMKDKPTKWGIKLFVLAESSNGYTINFNVYSSKSHTASVHGPAYDAVMDLIQPLNLGTGYHIYMDNVYTSPRLFLDLASMKFGACGTYRDTWKGYPKERANAITRKSTRGTIRWIREDPLVFVKWMDTREVSMCSTIHPAFTGETIQRRMKDGDGQWRMKDIPCPTTILAYNKNMGGVSLSTQLIQNYSTQRKTASWYRTLFLHFLDIATTNAYILHCEISKTQKVQNMTHKDFVVELVSQLCRVDKTGVPISRSTEHIPIAISPGTDASMKASQGRNRCQRCLQVEKKRKDTPWKCKSCDVALCLVLDRNCFEDWHRFLL